MWKRVEVLERNSLSASYLSHFIPQKELPIDVEAGVGFGASLAVFWATGNCPKSSFRSPYRWYFPSPIANSNIVLNLILNIFRDKVLIIGEIKDKGIFVQLKSLFFSAHLSVLPVLSHWQKYEVTHVVSYLKVVLSFASCSYSFMYILKLEL